MRVSSYLTNDFCDPRLRIVFFYLNYMEVSFYDEKKQKNRKCRRKKINSNTIIITIIIIITSGIQKLGILQNCKV